MSSGKILLAVLGGVATGALLGVLFAPDKGTGTRKKISKKADHYAEDLKDRFNDFMDEMKERFEPAQEEVSATIGKAKKQLQRNAREAKHAIE